MEGVVRGYNWMEPLLRTSRISPHLLRTMCVLRSSLDSVPREQWYPSCKRVYARLTHELKRLGDDVTEMDASLIALTSDNSGAVAGGGGAGGGTGGEGGGVHNHHTNRSTRKSLKDTIFARCFDHMQRTRFDA